MRDLSPDRRLSFQNRHLVNNSVGHFGLKSVPTASTDAVKDSMPSGLASQLWEWLYMQQMVMSGATLQWNIYNRVSKPPARFVWLPRLALRLQHKHFIPPYLTLKWSVRESSVPLADLLERWFREEKFRMQSAPGRKIGGASPPVPNGTFGRVCYFVWTNKESKMATDLSASRDFSGSFCVETKRIVSRWFH